jgi:serine/threonine protein phosphatase PrpC
MNRNGRDLRSARVSEMLCLACGQRQPDDNRFCEDCGAPLAAAPAAVAPSPAPSAAGRDRLELRVSDRLAGLSDRGLVHRSNDDFLALATAPGWDVLVVCDGLSSAQHADQAAAVAAEAACSVLRGGGGPESLMAAAVQAAQDAAAGIPFDRGSAADPPETTLVAALRRGRRLTVGWLGDSRAYWIGPDGARPLTRDHSWLEETVAAGKLSRAEALRSPLAHAVTRTVGGPTGAADQPSLLTLDLPPTSGVLLLCSDGLWNTVPEPWQLAALVRRTNAADALTLARALVAHALDAGGHDNITAAVLLLPELDR